MILLQGKIQTNKTKAEGFKGRYTIIKERWRDGPSHIKEWSIVVVKIPHHILKRWFVCDYRKIVGVADKRGEWSVACLDVAAAGRQFVLIHLALAVQSKNQSPKKITLTLKRLLSCQVQSYLAAIATKVIRREKSIADNV